MKAIFRFSSTFFVLTIFISGACGSREESTRPRKVDPAATAKLLDVIKNGGSVGELLDAGADPNIRDNRGMTALHFAVQSQERIDNVRMLIADGANVNARAADGRTPLFDATPQAIEVLLANGADLNARDTKGNSVLHDKALRLAQEAAIGGADFRTREDEFIQASRLVTAKGFDINTTNNEGKTVMDVATEAFLSEKYSAAAVEGLPHIVFLLEVGGKYTSPASR